MRSFALSGVFVIIVVLFGVLTFVVLLVAAGLLLLSISCHLFIQLLSLFLVHLLFVKFILLLIDNELQ